MTDPFLIRAFLAGLGVAIAAGPLGCFVVWRRMAYFGDATAHAAILGVALSLLMGMPVAFGTMAIALAMALTVSALSARAHGVDATLGVLAHSALAIGLVAISFANGVRVDLSSFLFGDILAVSREDLVVIFTGALLVLALLVWRWQGLLLATLNPELATAAGISPRREQLVLTLALALTVAVALKVVGALLISAMLLVPPAVARSAANTPERMAVGAVLVGIGAVIGGLWASWTLDTPAGPSIVTVAAIAFALSLPLQAIRRGR
ncbi:MAG: metal ABC transporter permease [Pseudomonadota bacterium]|nr:metal ABC transporter permease [Pseudomonadota bacterium]MEE3071238.1 metal ABC transporter permease [Pseudomonadota bacterium]